MAYIDVFNGDADGICALQQLRLAEPVENTLVTGVKRDIALLARVKAQTGDTVTTLDISMDKNKAALSALLEKGTHVIYFDHHYAGDIPRSTNLTATIDPSPEICTGLLVDQYLRGKFRPWAVVAAFGDNMDSSARLAANQLNLEENRLQQLRELGIYINYNAYGTNVEDLYYPPDQLFLKIKPFEDPFDFIEQSETFAHLKDGYTQDMTKTQGLKPQLVSAKYALFVLPSQSWARRVSGVFGNQLAQNYPQRAHALLTELPAGGYVVSVRAPLVNRTGADELCRAFPTGGGRKAAAGINNLPDNLFDEFSSKFKEIFS